MTSLPYEWEEQGVEMAEKALKRLKRGRGEGLEAVDH